MLCSTGDACGFTDTRSPDCSWVNHSDVMIETIDAHEAWCPPTFSPLGLGRMRLAWWIIAVDVHSTCAAISLSTSPLATALCKFSGERAVVIPSSR